eukprot:1564446-Amphidinium_carterae.1
MMSANKFFPILVSPTCSFPKPRSASPRDVSTLKAHLLSKSRWGVGTLESWRQSVQCDEVLETAGL